MSGRLKLYLSQVKWIMSNIRARLLWIFVHSDDPRPSDVLDATSFGHFDAKSFLNLRLFDVKTLRLFDI